MTIRHGCRVAVVLGLIVSVGVSLLGGCVPGSPVPAGRAGPSEAGAAGVEADGGPGAQALSEDEVVPGTQAPPEVEAPTPTPRPTRTATPDIPEPARPLLMAHTMPWYQTPEVSGTWGWHWTMDHFRPARQDDEGRREIASYLYPLTGPYDSRDPAILEYQTLLMVLGGIDGVIVDWYGTEDFRDYAVLHEATGDLFEAVKRAGLQFALCYEDQTIGHMVDGGYLAARDVTMHGQALMRTLADTWFRDPAYLKVGDRPALFVFGPQVFSSPADWDHLFSELDPRPALITLDGHLETAGLATYPWPPMWQSRDGVLSPETLDGYLTAFYRKAGLRDYVVAGAFPGFRDIYQDAGVAAETRYLDPRDGETFRATLQMALDQHPDVIQLITWNDYGETTSIEPTQETGYRYLEMVQAARRETDPAFTPTADDLRLPLRLWELRRAHTGDAAANARLDEVYEAIVAGDLEGARAVLAEVEAEP